MTVDNMKKALELNLSPHAKQVIDGWIRMKEPIGYGTESHCLSDFRNWCVDAYEMPSLICLREDHRYTPKDREEAIKHMNDYFNNEPKYYPNKFKPYQFVNSRTRTDNKAVQLRYHCEKYLHEHIGSLAEHACIAVYGSVKKALLETSTWIELWNDFEDWFEEKRRLFMAKQKAEIEKIVGAEVAEKRKIPHSHGGVANLLKTLTKTMEQQGADIRSIAKMQYAVCKQANIYLPDEFITDVAVALDVEGEL